MVILDFIAEQKIADAIERGELVDLPGAGRPLDMDEDALVPEDLRMAYRILKNSGFVPPEVEVLRDVSELERCIYALPESDARAFACRKLQLLCMRLEASGVNSAAGSLRGAYYDRILDRLSRGTKIP